MRSWAALGAYVGGPGAVLGLCWWSGGGLGTNVGDLGPLLGLYWRSWHALGATVRSWAALGAYVGGLGPLLGPILAVLGRSWALSWRSWAALGTNVGDLGPLLGLCWRSRAALRASVRDLGRSWGLMLAVLGGLGPKSGPNPSGSRSQKGRPPKSPSAPRVLEPVPIFYIDMYSFFFPP